MSTYHPHQPWNLTQCMNEAIATSTAIGILEGLAAGPTSPHLLATAQQLPQAAIDQMLVKLLNLGAVQFNPRTGKWAKQ